VDYGQGSPGSETGTILDPWTEHSEVLYSLVEIAAGGCSLFGRQKLRTKEVVVSKRIRKFRLLVLSVIALVGLACSQKPSESDAREKLEAYYVEKLGPAAGVQIVNFKKTDGLSEVENGAQYYTMDYQAEAVVNNGVEYQFKAGEGFKQEGKLRFVRSEKGWRLVDQRTVSYEMLPKAGRP